MKKVAKSVWITVILVVVVLMACCGYIGHVLFVRSAVVEQHWVYIRPYDTPETLLNQLSPCLSSAHVKVLTHQVLSHRGVYDRIAAGSRSGAYCLQPGTTVWRLSQIFNAGLQTPVRFSFHEVRFKEELAGKLSRNLMVDSVEVLRAMTDTSFLHLCQTDTNNVIGMFLPDTYEVYWNISAAKLVRKMKSAYDAFWTDSRLQKAKALGVTPQQVSILCSIAEEETQNRAERGVVARLYWNRLQRGMLLQADPTVKYALHDFSLRRILKSHLTVDSPYNTYRYGGLPPGPIRVPEKTTIDALLNSEPHPYIYMCAKEDFSGLHRFAKSLSEHNRNAARYHRALNQLKKK